jgi:hypothetical protein
MAVVHLFQFSLLEITLFFSEVNGRGRWSQLQNRVAATHNKLLD